MLGPKADLHEAVMNELDYLRAYARENGEAAAWRNAADEIVKLRRYADETKARLAESEAQAAAMREALTEALSLVDASNDCPCPDCTEGRRIQEHIHSALSSSAGRETAERLRLLEELLGVAAAFVEGCDLVECSPRDAALSCYEGGRCRIDRVKEAVKALKGGDADAGTKA